MKSLWALSALILFIGVCVLAYSYFPETVQQPFMTTVNQPRDTVLKDGTATSYFDYFVEDISLNQGDRVSIVASSTDQTLTAQVTDISYLLNPSVISSQQNMTNINLDVTIPRSSNYAIEVSRYRANNFIVFLTQTTANVEVTTHTIEQVLVQQYRDVTTYPHKDLQIAAIAIMIAGIGVGVLTVSQGKNKDQPSPTQ